MRLHALLVFTFAVLHARAATIPEHIVPELEKKLSEAVKEVLDKDALTLKDDLNDQELLEQVNAGDNIVAESGPSVKTEDAPSSEDGSTDINREEVDLKNPGPPQIQRHDYQNPEVFDDEKLKESSVSHSAVETQNLLHKGLLDITQQAQQQALDNEKIILVRKSIDELQENFSNHLRQLNEVIKKYSKSEDAGSLRTVAVLEQGSALTPDLKKVQSEFDSSIQTLSEGLAHLKADGNNTTSQSSTFIQTLSGWMQSWVTSTQNNIANLNTAIQNAIQQTNAPPFLQGPFNALSNVLNSQQQQPQQQQSQQQQGFFENVYNGITGWFNPTTSAPPTIQPFSSSPATDAITNLSTEYPEKNTASIPSQSTGSEDAVEASKNVEGAAEKGHGGGQGSEHSDNSNSVGLDADVASAENKNDITKQPQVAEQQKDNKEKIFEEVITKTENSNYKEKPIELTTTVEELQKIEEPVTEIESLILVRSKEENLESEEMKTEESRTELPSMKDEITTVLTNLMMNDESKETMNEEPKVEDRISSDLSIKENDKIETTELPIKEVIKELSTEEIPTTEGIREMLMTDSLLGLMNSPIKEIAEPDVSGTEASAIDVVTEKEELTNNVEVIKVEEPMTTITPLVQVEDRNQEPPVTEVDIKKNEEEEVGRTTEGPDFDDLNLEVLPKEEIKIDETDSDPTTEVPKIEENKEGKKEIKRRVVRRLIKRTLL